MAETNGDKEIVRRLLTKPNRVAIVRLIGEKGEVSFTELKSKLNMGVGTLYYHLDALSEYITQNASRQYTLTDAGRRIYDALKQVELPTIRLSPKSSFSARDVARELLFLESHIERLGQEPSSTLSTAVGLIIVGSVLAAQFRVEPALLFIRSRAALPSIAVIDFLLSWLSVFAITTILSTFVWRGQRNFLGLGASSAFALVPMIFFLVFDGLRRAFGAADFIPLYQFPYFLILQILLAVWSSYILTLCVRSAANLTLEKALVVTLTVLMVNFGYLWIRPIVVR